ncbi:rhomboid-like protein [Streptomyces kronopolitis]|uniref:rhomboid-like protein n=1 Tax=Streptomyces kronopolitis TaxID=1612435 RepID=UPI003D975478
MSWLGTADRTRAGRAPADAPGRPPEPDTVPDAGPGLLTGIPRQRGGRAAVDGDAAAQGDTAQEAAARRRGTVPGLRWRPWRLLPTPAGTPFTFGYAVLLVVTSLVTEYGDPGLVSDLLQGSSTDVAHLARSPLMVLVASALWIAGGMTSAYALGFLFVLTALERRLGGLRTAAVFFGGHAVATLATELPVAFSVAAGRLPESSLHRLDYGISFGVMTCIGALAGLLPAWLRWPLLAGVGYLAVTDLLAYADPMTAWGHLLSLTLGVAAWPLLRHWRAHRTRPAPLLGDLGRPALQGAGPT